MKPIITTITAVLTKLTIKSSHDEKQPVETQGEPIAIPTAKPNSVSGQ
jgi:hypothetical protein